MAFKGEDIKFKISGNQDFNLDDFDFAVLIYPDGKYSENIIIKKNDMIKVDSNEYVATIPHSTSKTMILGSYTIEFVLLSEESTMSIYVKRRAFEVYDSASKDEEL